jgi:hypothetical protein
VAATNFAPLLALGFDAERDEPGVPELLQKRTQLMEAFGPDAIQPAGPFPSLDDEPGVTKNTKVLRYRRPGDIGEMAGDRARRQFRVLDEQQDLAAARFDDRIEEHLHYA